MYIQACVGKDTDVMNLATPMNKMAETLPACFHY